MILNFKNETKEGLTLQVKKGNKKPIPEYVWIINLTSSYYCPSVCFCPYHRLKTGLCYALKFELNPLFKKNTLKRRAKDTKCIDYLVKNNKVELLANKLLKANKRAIKHKLKYLRISETGDLKTLKHLVFINNLADILYNKIGCITTIYTHRKDIYNAFKDQYQQSPGLRILGSGFMCDANFTTDPTGASIDCSGNCINCFKEHKTAPCYNINLKGVTIYEPLRGTSQTTKPEPATAGGV